MMVGEFGAAQTNAITLTVCKPGVIHTQMHRQTQSLGDFVDKPGAAQTQSLTLYGLKTRIMTQHVRPHTNTLQKK